MPHDIGDVEFSWVLFWCSQKKAADCISPRTSLTKSWRIDLNCAVFMYYFIWSYDCRTLSCDLHWTESQIDTIWGIVYHTIANFALMQNFHSDCRNFGKDKNSSRREELENFLHHRLYWDISSQSVWDICEGPCLTYPIFGWNWCCLCFAKYTCICFGTLNRAPWGSDLDSCGVT